MCIMIPYTSSTFLIRSKTEHKVVYPADVILFEGIQTLYSPALRNLMHMKIFVDTDSDTRLARRSGCGLCVVMVTMCLYSSQGYT